MPLNFVDCYGPVLNLTFNTFFFIILIMIISFITILIMLFFSSVKILQGAVL